jgi:hypothetical protein
MGQEAKNMTKINWKKHFNYFIQSLFFFLLLGSIALFFIGFHNLDLGYNILAISYMENNSIIDKYIDHTMNGDYINYYDTYRIGLTQMMLAFCIAIISSLNLNRKI